MESSADAHYRAGFEAFARGDFEHAVVHTRRALEIDAQHREALRTLGMALFRLEQHAAALVVGRRLVEVAPEDVLSYTTISLFLQKNGFIKEAEDASAKAKVLTWKKQLREGSTSTPGLSVLDSVAPSPPVMPLMPGPPAKRPPPPVAPADADAEPGPS